MTVPLQVVFDDASQAQSVAEWAAGHLEDVCRLDSDVMGCCVMIDTHGDAEAAAIRYRVVVQLTLPNDKIIVAHNQQAGPSLYASLDDAFDAAKQLVVEYIRRWRDRDGRANACS